MLRRGGGRGREREELGDGTRGEEEEGGERRGSDKRRNKGQGKKGVIFCH